MCTQILINIVYAFIIRIFVEINEKYTSRTWCNELFPCQIYTFAFSVSSNTKEPLLRNCRVLQETSVKNVSESKIPRQMYNLHCVLRFFSDFLPLCTTIFPENKFKNAAGSCPWTTRICKYILNIILFILKEER